MSFFKRGLISILRKPGKSITLLLLIFILGNVIAGAISVKQAIRNTEQAMYDKVGIMCQVTVDYDKLYGGGKDEEKWRGDDAKEEPGQLESLTADIIESVGASSYVKYYDYFTGMWLESLDMEPAQSENGPIKPVTRDVEENTGLATFQFSGGQNPEISDFVQGKATLYQGRVFTDEEMAEASGAVLISKQLAEINGLSVGSVIRFKRDIYRYIIYDGGAEGKPVGGSDDSSAGSSKSPDGDEPIKLEEPELARTLQYEFTVIGIFDPVPDTVIGEDGKPITIDSSLINVIYTTNKNVNTCNEEIAAADSEINGYENGYYYSIINPIFVLKEAEDLEAFKTETMAKLPEYYMVADNSKEFSTVTAPMSNMGWIAGIILYVAVGATLLILSLLITLFLRDRKHEMGIYLSLGERKIKIAGQILAEVMMIAVIAITLSLFTGNMIAKNISGNMLENQIIAEYKNGPDGVIPQDLKSSFSSFSPYSPYYYGSNLSGTDLIDAYKVTLDTYTILLFFACGIGTVMLSTLIPIAYTLRLNPKKILM